jgi:hypothetical protein
MKRCDGLLAVPLAAILAVGCDSATPASAPAPAQAEVLQTNAKTGSQVAARKKKKEPGVAPAKEARTKPRADL